jgi:hypothetical protein
MLRCEWAEEPGAVSLQCCLLLQVGDGPSSLLCVPTTGLEVYFLPNRSTLLFKAP